MLKATGRFYMDRVKDDADGGGDALKRKKNILDIDFEKKHLIWENE
jgi:hypothetical protein